MARRRTGKCGEGKAEGKVNGGRERAEARQEVERKYQKWRTEGRYGGEKEDRGQEGGDQTWESM